MVTPIATMEPMGAPIGAPIVPLLPRPPVMPPPLPPPLLELVCIVLRELLDSPEMTLRKFLPPPLGENSHMSMPAVRGLHSSTFQVNLSRF
jgi:hypothetical protein